MRRRAATIASLAAGALAAAPSASAQTIEPGASVPAVLGLAWTTDADPFAPSGGVLEALLAPRVTATVTVELAVRLDGDDSPRATALTAGRAPLGSLAAALPPVVATFPDGGVTGRPTPLRIRRDGSARDVPVIVSLTAGP